MWSSVFIRHGAKGWRFESPRRLSLLNAECIISRKTKNVSFEEEDRTCKTRNQIERVKQEVWGMEDDEGNQIRNGYSSIQYDSIPIFG